MLLALSLLATVLFRASTCLAQLSPRDACISAKRSMAFAEANFTKAQMTTDAPEVKQFFLEYFQRVPALYEVNVGTGEMLNRETGEISDAVSAGLLEKRMRGQGMFKRDTGATTDFSYDGNSQCTSPQCSVGSMSARVCYYCNEDQNSGSAYWTVPTGVAWAPFDYTSTGGKCGIVQKDDNGNYAIFPGSNYGCYTKTFSGAEASGRTCTYDPESNYAYCFYCYPTG